MSDFRLQAQQAQVLPQQPRQGGGWHEAFWSPWLTGIGELIFQTLYRYF